MQSLFHFTAVSVFIFSVLIFPVNAEDPDSLQVYEGEVITVIAEKENPIAEFNQIAARITLSIHDTPLSINVITQKTIKEQNAVTLSDALMNVSSINIQSNMGTQDYFLIRGFESLTAGMILLIMSTGN